MPDAGLASLLTVFIVVLLLLLLLALFLLVVAVVAVCYMVAMCLCSLVCDRIVGIWLSRSYSELCVFVCVDGVCRHA